MKKKNQNKNVSNEISAEGIENENTEKNRIEHFLKTKNIDNDFEEMEEMLENTYQAFY